MARKREERLQDVPLSISAISGDTVANERLFRISDYAGKIPNFSALQQNTRTSGLYIRGVGGNANNDGAEPGVGLIVDNVFITHNIPVIEFLAHEVAVMYLGRIVERGRVDSEERRVVKACVSSRRPRG